MGSAGSRRSSGCSDMRHHPVGEPASAARIAPTDTLPTRGRQPCGATSAKLVCDVDHSAGLAHLDRQRVDPHERVRTGVERTRPERRDLPVEVRGHLRDFRAGQRLDPELLGQPAPPAESTLPAPSPRGFTPNPSSLFERVLAATSRNWQVASIVGSARAGRSASPSARDDRFGTCAGGVRVVAQGGAAHPASGIGAAREQRV